MKKDRVLNPLICAAIAQLGHTEYFAVADAGLPIPPEVKTIDLSLVRGVPGFQEVLDAVSEELVIDSFIYAEELPGRNEKCFSFMNSALKGIPGRSVPHTEFKELIKSARVVIRTGECSPYANIILVGGVNF